MHANGGHDHQQGHNLPNVCKFYANLNLILKQEIQECGMGRVINFDLANFGKGVASDEYANELKMELTWNFMVDPRLMSND